MERLTPPDIVTITEPEPGWLTIPHEGIAREEFIKQWRGQMTKPLPDSGALKVERPGWSADLGRTKWLRTVPGISATAEQVMSTETDMPDATVWAEVTRAFVLYVEPLARYTAGWATSLEAWAPHRPPPLVGDALRACRRKVANKVRDDMKGEPLAQIKRETIASVIADRQSLDDFFSRPHTRHARDEITAIVIYLDALSAFVSTPSKGRDKLNREQLTTVVDHTDDLLDDPGLPTPEFASPEFIAECQQMAEQVTLDVLSSIRISERSRPLYTAAYESMVLTQRNRLLRGLPVNLTERLMYARFKAVWINQWRKSKANKGIPAGKGRGSRHPGDAFDASLATSRDIREAIAAVCDRISEQSSEAHGQLTWEHQIAIELLSATGDDISAFSPNREIRDYVAQRWKTERPPTSTTQTGHAAGFLVLSIIRIALFPPHSPEGEPT